MNYKLSLIIPTYNNEIYLSRLIDSLLNDGQNYNYELVIIDDGSKDNTKQVLKKYKHYNNINLVFLKKNHGVSFARNIGINKSKGEYICFLDADDSLAHNFFNDIFNILNHDYECIIYGTTMIYNDYQKNYIPKLSGYYTKEQVIKEKDYLSIYFINWVTNKIFKKSVISNIKFDINYKSAEDLKFITNVFGKINNYFYISKSLYMYNRMNNNSITKNDITYLVDSVHHNIKNVEKMIFDHNLDVDYFNEYKCNMIKYCKLRVLRDSVNEEMMSSLIKKNNSLNGDVISE